MGPAARPAPVVATTYVSARIHAGVSWTSQCRFPIDTPVSRDGRQYEDAVQHGCISKSEEEASRDSR